MSETAAGWIVTALTAYLAAGAVFAVAFVLVGVGRIDPSAREGTWGFRVLLLPGSALLWPWLGMRWIRGAGPPVESNAHRRAAREAVEE